MRLKRLELQGFKSFLDRTILTFDQGVTGVVGPNGCGKSNIVDAIQWVMGEQSAKHLRGNAMQDVIFAGSDKQAPTSMAEVTLVLDKEGASLPAALVSADRGEEVAVTRRLFRDGTSEYSINKTGCRLKDVHELFMDTGIGKRAYSIIEQGQIDRMVNVKPEDRRYIFEEVAGITKYRTKRKEAERKLEQTQQNLSRLQDIIQELEKRMRSLKIQASRAKKYKDIKVELETADLFVLGRKLYKLKTAIAELGGDHEQKVQQRSEADAKFSQLDAQITEKDVLRIDQEKQTEVLEQQGHQFALEIQRLEGQLTLIEEQRRHLNESKHTIAQESEELGTKLEEMIAQNTEAITEKSSVERALSDLVSGIEGLEGALQSLEKSRSEWDQRLRVATTEFQNLAQEEVSLKNQLEYTNTSLEKVQVERTSINDKLGEAAALIEERKTQLASANVRIEASEEKSRSIENDVTKADSDCKQISQQLTELETSLFEERENFHTQNSRKLSLIELAENLEGYSPTAKEILTKLDSSELEAMPLAELLFPDKEVEAQLELLLGDKLNTLVVKTTEDAKKLAALVDSKDLEKVGIIAQEELPIPTLQEIASLAGKALKDRVRVERGYEGVAAWILGNAYLCDSIEEVFELRAKYSEKVFISREGWTIAYQDKLISGGRLPTKSGIFERRREIESLSQICTTLESGLQEKEVQRAQLLSELESLETKHVELKDELSASHIESVESRKEKEKIQQALERVDADYTDLMERSDQNQELLESLRTTLEEATTKYNDVTERKIALETDREKAKEELEQSEVELREKAIVVNEKKVEHSKLTERFQHLSQQLEQVEADIEHTKKRQEALAERKVKEEEQLASLDGNENKTNSLIEESRDEHNKVLAKISELRTAKDETAHQLNLLREEKDALSKSRERLAEEIQSLELKLTQEKSDFEHQNNISVERYHKEAPTLDETAPIDLEKLPLFTSQRKFNWDTLPVLDREAMLEAHLEDLRKKVDRYGEVNLTAINEYEEVQERSEFLTKQKEDIDNSIKILEEAIEKIDITTVDRFRETVFQVNEKFREVFPILFGGGKAELSLTNPENILESGVDIMVQPPGKRLQSISLLSGGEKALTATSLILAIFARKPSPFCLLDEVDAPLDDANVSRFNTVVKYMAQKSQFIIITHNRRTMEVADVLYGVTMERSGISKMTGVTLH